MNILSIHYGHDSSACILKDNNIVFYFKEERLSKHKRDCVPFLSIKKCLEFFDEEITHILITSFRTDESTIGCIIKLISCFIEIKKSIEIIVFTYNHHLTHVGTSFFNSGFEESLVVVVDGRGSVAKLNHVECESVFLMSYEYGLKKIQKNFFENSSISSSSKNNLEEKVSKYGGICNIYNTATLLIGQSELESGKTMGLSSYGKKIDNFPRLFLENEIPNNELFEIINKKRCIFKSYSNKITKQITKNNYQFYADYAHEIQTQTQEVVGNLIEKAIKKTGVKKVCISGGYGMNVVANYYYLQRFPDVDFYFEPIADDTGSSIGAAKMFYFFEKKDKKIKPLETTSFHGINYDISSYVGETVSIKKISHLLQQNKSVAIYKGLAEVGQRALGNRSIFFNALNPSAKDLVNKIKKREWYRPFAAVVLEEDASTYFDMGRIKSSPFMTTCFPVKSEYVKVIPGVTHVDNTCRIQTVSKKDNYLYELLCEFKKETGHGILLNTSFNLSGKPLVESPDDAFEVLNNSCLDYLWFEETQQLFQNNKSISLNYE